MQNVSDSWKNNQRQTLVDESYLEISFDIADPDALQDASASDDGSVYLANTAQIVSEVDKNIVPYATLEQNLFVLDGKRKAIPATDFGDTGYIGRTLSGAAGTFDVAPEVEISFSVVHEPVIPGITITWGDAYSEYAESFKILAYSGTELLTEKQITGNSSVKSIVEMDIQGYNRIVIQVLRWCLPYHRPRISEVFVGINKVYSKQDVMTYSHSQTVDPLSAALPKAEITFGIDNTSNDYDPNNITGMSKYLMERQEIRTRYGYQFGGVKEWIPGGVFYLSEWESPQNGLNANFTARDILEFMTAIYTEGVYAPDGASLYTLAERVFQKANLPLNSDGSVKWHIDESLKEIMTVAPLPLCSLAECLQLIANAGCCVLYADREGILHIEPAAVVASDYEINPFNSYQKSEISLSKPLSAVEVNVYSYFPGKEGEELFNGTVFVDGTKEVTITYSDPAIGVSAVVTGGTLVSAVYNTYACKLTLTGSGDVTVVLTGAVLKDSESVYRVDYAERGEVQTVENELITSTERAHAVGNWTKDYLCNRKTLTSDWRADPRLDALDIVTNINDYSQNYERMTNVKFDYNGAFHGTGEGRVIDGVDSAGL